MLINQLPKFNSCYIVGRGPSMQAPPRDRLIIGVNAASEICKPDLHIQMDAGPLFDIGDAIAIVGIKQGYAKEYIFTRSEINHVRNSGVAAIVLAIKSGCEDFIFAGCEGIFGGTEIYADGSVGCRLTIYKDMVEDLLKGKKWSHLDPV